MPRTGEKRAYLDRTVGERPEFAGSFSLFRALLAFIDGREGSTGIAFRRRSGGGRGPILSPESAVVDPGRCAAFLDGLFGVLLAESPKAEGAIAAAREALRKGTLDLPRLVAASWTGDRTAVEKAAGAVPFDPPLLLFVLDIALNTALETFAGAVSAEEIPSWEEGICPVCGAPPAMDELCGEEGRRFLSCSRCAFRWPFRRARCPFCGNDDPGTLGYFIAGDGPVRVSVCRKCRRYIKSRDSRLGNAPVPLDVEDIATLHLDILAGKEGFERER